MTYAALNIVVTLKCGLESCSGQLEMVQVDRTHTSSYSSSIVTMAIF